MDYSQDHDCPLHSQLQDSLKHCHERTALIAATHGDYLHIIDDLKNDLDSLSCQVNMVQQQFCTGDLDASNATMATTTTTTATTSATTTTTAASEDSGMAPPSPAPFEAALRQLESQNDLLQTALEQTTKHQDRTRLELEQNNENFKCQIEQLQCALFQKESRINQLNDMLTRLSHLRQETQPSPTRCQDQHQRQHQREGELLELRSQLEHVTRRNDALICDLERSQKQERFLLSETRKLNDELIDSKRKNNDLNVQTRRLAELLKKQESHRMELTRKYELMEANYEEQSRQLRAANAQMNMLQQRFATLEKRDDEHNMERNLLREEVLSLKEKEAAMLGKQKSVQEQLVKMEKELYTAHVVIKEQQCILQRNDCAHAEIEKRLQEARNDIKRQFNLVVEDYNKLQEEYEKQNEIRKQNEKVIESFRKWKEAQLKSDEATRCSFREYEQHIKLLLEDKQKLLDKERELQRDFTIIQKEMERLKSCSFSTAATGPIFVEKSILPRMQQIRRVSRRVSQQSSCLKEDDEVSLGGPL